MAFPFEVTRLPARGVRRGDGNRLATGGRPYPLASFTRR